MLKKYELTYLASPDFSEEEIKTYSEKIAGFVADENGLQENQISPQKRVLAYNINGKSSAFLTTIIFKIASESLEKLEKKLRAEDRILRYILIVKKPRKEKINLRAKAHREKRKTALAEKSGMEKIRESRKAEIKDIDKKIEEILNQ